MTLSHISHSISIRCFADGFSFYTYANGCEGQRLLERRQVREYAMVDEMLAELKAMYPNGVGEVRFLLHTSHYCLVPQVLFQPDCAEAWLLPGLGTAHVSQRLSVSADVLDALTCVNVYAAPRYWALLPEKFETLCDVLNTEHYMSHLLRHDLWATMSQGTAAVHLHVAYGTLGVAVTANGKFMLANDFAYKTPEDAAYHVLNVYKQLDLSVDDTQVLLCGEVDTLPLKKILSNYIAI